MKLTEAGGASRVVSVDKARDSGGDKDAGAGHARSHRARPSLGGRGPSG